MVTRTHDASSAWPSRRSRRWRSDRTPRSVRRVLVVGAACCSVLAGGPALAAADVARLESLPATQIRPTEPDHRIVVTDQRGAKRTVGPVPAGRLVAAADGRHLAVVPENQRDDASVPWIAPLDGTPPRPLRLPAGTLVTGALSSVSWTPDGTELLVSNAVGWDPSAFAKPSQITSVDHLRWTALRCPIATAVCTELPAPGTLVVGVPGGLLTTSSLLSFFPMSWVLEGGGDQRPPEWERPTSRRGRTLIRIANEVRVASTQLVEPTPTTLGRVRRSGATGVPLAAAAVGGPDGAVISRVTFVTELERRRGRVRLRQRIRSPRFLLARPGTPLRAFASRPIVLPRDVRRELDRTTTSPGQRLHFHPLFATADGWVGGGGSALGAGDTAVLATMDVEGRVRPITVRGRPATAQTLLRAVHRRMPGRVTDPIEIIGYEAAGNLIVTVRYQPPSLNSMGGADTLRVPLRGSALPTVIRGRVDAAW